jgi:hypothetical protein
MASTRAMKSTQRRTRRTSKTSQTTEERVAASLTKIDQLRPATAHGAKVIALLRSWLTDETDYDETAWPPLKKALDQQRAHVGARRLFNG